MYLEQGNVSCKGVNVSNTEVNQISGIDISYTTSSISFSSFRNNTATGNSCFYLFNFNQSSHKITNTNIIENRGKSNFNGIVTCYQATLSLNHCSVFGNSAPNAYIFFIGISGSIAFTKCSISDDQKKCNSNSINYGTTDKLFINYYEYLELDECKRGLDVWSNILPNTPTPIPFSTQTPKRTPQKTPINTIKITQMPEQVNSFNPFLGFFDF